MQKRIERQTLHLYPKGELDMKNADALRRAIDEEIDRRGIRTVVFYLDQVQFIDSSGLGVILGRYKKLLPVGGRIQIFNAPPHLYKILELSGLTKIIETTLSQKGAQIDARK